MLKPRLPPNSTTLASCNAVLDSVAHDICASVPFYLGVEPGLKDSTPRAASGHLLIWALYSAGATRAAVDDPLRVWVIGILHRIARETGFKQANVAAAFLEDPEYAKGGAW